MNTDRSPQQPQLAFTCPRTLLPFPSYLQKLVLRFAEFLHRGHDAVLRELQLAAGTGDFSRRRSHRNGVPLSELHCGAPGGLPDAHGDVRGDCSRAWLRLLSSVCPARGRAVRRLHTEMLQWSAVLSQAGFGVAPGAAGSRAREMWT